MTRVVLDEALRAKLKGLTDEIEICDERGRVVGHYLPTEQYHRLIYDWINSQIDDQELKRRQNEPGGRTLGEIWQRLGQQ
jgi:hypothetical protein